MEQRDETLGNGEAVGTLPDRSTAKGRMTEIVTRIHAARNLDEIFLELKEEIRQLFDVEQITLYAVDRERRELYSKFLHNPLEGLQEIRVPINEHSVSGYCARHGKIINIANAYDKAELNAISTRLTFDHTWDERSGFRTRQMLAVPILHEQKFLMGVLLFLNKRQGHRFSPEEEKIAQAIAEPLGLSLRYHYQATQRRPTTKFDYLLERNLITRQELQAAVTEARRKNQDVETILIEQYRIAKREVGRAISLFYGYPFVEFDDQRLVDPALLKGINFDYMKTNFWMPLRREGSTVDILVDNPKDLQKIEHIQLLMKGYTLRLFVGLRKDILQYLYSSSGRQDLQFSTENILGELTSEEDLSESEEDDALGVHEDDNAIVRLASQVIIDAYKQGASDIHVEPYSARQDTVIRIRIDGICREYLRIPASYRRALVSRIKIMARLDIAERRKPQDGKIKFRLPTNREIELRVATIPTANANEDVVMRILTATEAMPLEQLGMTERNLQAFKGIIQRPYGLVLVVGPTGSGKTTTLHSALGVINTPERKIWTAEDPVEITQYGLRQVQVNPRIGFTFAAALRAFLRADPDVIMVGEMRDQETAHIGIEASLTGHLVFSTLHTNSAPETVTRLLDMGLDPFNFADALLGVQAQRLVRTLCVSCKESYHPPEEVFAELRQAYGPEAFDALGLAYTPDFKLYRASSCPQCNTTGYKGRIAIQELLLGSPALRRLIHARSHTADLFACAQQEGMTTLLQDGILKVLRGLTDFTQVKAVASK